MINFLLTTMEAQNYEEFLDKEKGVFIKQLWKTNICLVMFIRRSVDIKKRDCQRAYFRETLYRYYYQDMSKLTNFCENGQN